ncbi:MAG: hypothetical protein GXN92_02900 [Candidatus Micrarchaeota archaeon]|nr:hypothetical protein [Candidatus Micrarchaeota archaeon]
MIKDILDRFLSKPIVEEKDIEELLREIQKALLKADVDPRTVFEITNYVKEKLKEKPKHVSYKRFILETLYKKLESMLGKRYQPELKPQKIMLVGLYGSGKTTTAAKLWHYFSKRGLSTRVTSVDEERPAGKEQLKTLVGNAYTENLDEEADVFIVDTPGRNAVDQELIQELQRWKERIKPDKIYLVMNAETGKYAKKIAEGFSPLGISGIILTKMDGSGRGGGALMAVQKLNVPVTFIGVGEKIDALREYDPKRFISRMLGMPDIEEIARLTEEMEKKIGKEAEFNFETFLAQMEAMQGRSVEEMASMMGMNLPKDQLYKAEEELKKIKAMINSMTPEERKNPDLVKSSDSRIRRIAKGSGHTELEVRQMLNQFFKAKKMVEKLKSQKGLLGRLPKGLLKKLRF